MAADFVTKVGDTGKPLVFTLKETDFDTGQLTAVDLTGFTTVEVNMTHRGSKALKISGGSCTPDADQVTNKGKAQYDWAAADVDTAGVFDLEILCTTAGGKEVRWPADETEGEEYFTVRILPNKA